MLIMPDIEEPFVPLGDGLFVDPYEARFVFSLSQINLDTKLVRSIITNLMNSLPTLFSNVKNPEPVLLPALTAAFAAIEKTGGKIIASLTALPTYGPGRLFLRDDGKQQGDAEKKLFTTEHPQWKKIAEKMVAAGVGADFFLTAPAGGYLDVATIGMLGDTHKIHSLTIYRSRIREYGWRNILLFKLCLSSRQ